MTETYTLQQLADTLELDFCGDADTCVSGVAAIEQAGASDITYVTEKRYTVYLASTKASIVILKPEWRQQTPKACLLSDNPALTYAHTTALLYPDRLTALPGIHPSAVISEKATIAKTAVISANVVISDDVAVGENTFIGPGVVLGEGSYIGDHCRLFANVTVTHNCQIGNKVIVHSGAVIGADGFGLVNDRGKWIKIPQVGRVLIADDVEIGANTTIDRGANKDTIIEHGVKLDNLIQVAHNVKIGANTAIAAKVGIAGSVEIGRNCTIGGATGIAGHLKIADGTHVHAMSLVMNHIPVAGQYAGLPVEPVKEWRKNQVRFKQLDSIARTVKQLSKKLL